jgi:hypothetical protein
MSGIIAQNSGRHTGLVKASSGGGGVWNLIETLTADGSGTSLDFTSGIDSTYDEYVFKFINIHPETDDAYLQFQGNAVGGSGYNETISSTAIYYQHKEDGTDAEVGYGTGSDLAQATTFQEIARNIGGDNDQSCSGYLHLFAPSDTTFVKHFILQSNTSASNDYQYGLKIAGYFNTTSAIDEIQFQMSTGNMDSGTISLYGIS